MLLRDLDKDCVDLAVAFEEVAVGEDALTVMFACCWLLADLIMQVERAKGVPADDSLSQVVQHLVLNVERLRWAAEEVKH